MYVNFQIKELNVRTSFSIIFNGTESGIMH